VAAMPKVQPDYGEKRDTNMRNPMCVI